MPHEEKVMATGTPLLLFSLMLISGFVFLAGCCLALYGRLRRCREECKKLRVQRINLRRELDACIKRHAELASSAGDAPKARSDAFLRLRTLAIRALHPDNAPGTSPAEKAMRSEMFKAFWPELVKIEAGIEDALPAQPVNTGEKSGSAPVHSPPGYTGLERRRHDVPINWRDRRKTGTTSGRSG